MDFIGFVYLYKYKALFLAIFTKMSQKEFVNFLKISKDKTKNVCYTIK